MAELAHVERAYRDGKFAILHDLTNCLRIGDAMVFGKDGTFTTIEVKTNPSRASPGQNRRVKAAAAAVADNASLPGADPRARLYDIDLPYKTHLDVLRAGTEHAARDSQNRTPTRQETRPLPEPSLLNWDFIGVSDGCAMVSGDGIRTHDIQDHNKAARQQKRRKPLLFSDS